MYITDALDLNVLPDYPPWMLVDVRRMKVDEIREMIMSIIERKKIHKIVAKSDEVIEILSRLIGIKFSPTIVGTNVKLKAKDSILVIQLSIL